MNVTARGRFSRSVTNRDGVATRRDARAARRSRSAGRCAGVPARGCSFESCLTGETMGLSHNEFRMLALAAFANRFGRAATRSEAQCVHAVAELETSCGDGWSDPAHDAANNFGAIQAGASWKNPDGTAKPTFGHKDSSPRSDGGSDWYNGRFRAYPTPLAGIEDLVRVVYQAKVPRGKNVLDRALLVLPEATKGDTLGFSRALYETGYYEGFGRDAYTRIQHHHKALTSALDRICRELGELLPDGSEPARTPPRVLYYRPANMMVGEDVKFAQRVV